MIYLFNIVFTTQYFQTYLIVMELDEEKNSISMGLIISNEQMKVNPIFPNEIKNIILDSPFYLLIFIPREDVVKINCFPSQTSSVKKILIKLTEFSPDLVKGISSVLKELNLSDYIMHTTGLCYEMERCFYETYLSGAAFQMEGIAEAIKEKFSSVAKIINVSIEDIPKS